MGKKIPKIIHYVWFGGNKPWRIRRCLKSWEYLKKDGWELKEWNEKNFDVNISKFTQKCFKDKKWGFIGDYIRAYAMFNEGGIYLDTDIILEGDINPFLKDKSFFSLMKDDSLNIDTGYFGSVKKQKYFKDVLIHLEKLDMQKLKYNQIVSNNYYTSILAKYGFKKKNSLQKLKNGTIVYDKSKNPFNHLTFNDWTNKTKFHKSLTNVKVFLLTNKLFKPLYPIANWINKKILHKYKKNEERYQI